MRSIFLYRMIVLICITVLLVSLLMTGGFVYLSRDALASVQLAELSQEAEAAGQLYLEYFEGSIDTEAFQRIAGTLVRTSPDARGIITDAQGSVVYATNRRDEYPDNYIETVFEQIRSALAGEPVELQQFMMSDGSPAIAVCVPVYDTDGVIQGSVFLLSPFSQVEQITDRVNRSIFLSAITVAPLMLLLASAVVRHIADPIRKMGEVAIRMRNGDFDARADEAQSGEVGLLARALNDLCDTLTQTIFQLRAEKGQLKQILASFSEGVAATDSLGYLTHYNAALMQMFGTVRIDNRLDLIPDPAIWDAFDEVYRTVEGQTMRYPLQEGDRMLWITISPVVTEEGGCTGVVGLFKDMTEIENLERMRREYVANVSHELRTPLTGIRGLLEPLTDGLVEEEADRQRYYKIMLREVMRLSRLITDMLQLSRLQSGTEYMELSEVDIQEILTDMLMSYRNEAAQHGISLVLEAGELPHVLTDPDRVEQVLVVLLDNAMKHTPAGGVITIRADVYERVNISVIDTGSGIPEEDVSHIFERFYTIDKSRKEGGTGLGLSIVQQIITKLGEKITVESELGKGSCFTFTLKKYVVNAIALGPAQEEWELMEEIDMLPPLLVPQIQKDEHDLVDAEYEVLPKPQKRKHKE